MAFAAPQVRIGSRTPGANLCASPLHHLMRAITIDPPSWSLPRAFPEHPNGSQSVKVKIGFSGFGPRTANHLIAFVALLCISEEKIAVLHRNVVNISFELTIFEQQLYKEGAGGSAF